jgi:ribonucleotide monophosphatase NagD (HAD superfamily)
LKAFQFVEKEMRKREPHGVFFMMGDNPKADIRGANNIGWYSFLTQTGIHQGDHNDKTDPATFVVSNFHEAV